MCTFTDRLGVVFYTYFSKHTHLERMWNKLHCNEAATMLHIRLKARMEQKLSELYGHSYY